MILSAHPLGMTSRHQRLLVVAMRHEQYSSMHTCCHFSYLRGDILQDPPTRPAPALVFLHREPAATTKRQLPTEVLILLRHPGMAPSSGHQRKDHAPCHK